MPANTFCFSTPRALRGLALAALCGVAVQAQASSDAAWREQQKQLVQACAKATGFNQPRAEGKPVLFSDEVGYTAQIITGRHAQPHMKNRTGRMLCLYKRSSGEAVVSELAR